MPANTESVGVSEPVSPAMMTPARLVSFADIGTIEPRLPSRRRQPSSPVGLTGEFPTVGNSPIPSNAKKNAGISAAPGTVLCAENLKKLGRMNVNERIVEDPGVYRPATPILEWQTPKRSTLPPTFRVWWLIALFCALEMVITGIVPRWLSESETTIFLCVFIPSASIITTFVTYMSVSRHLEEMVSLMESINSPADMDRVVERLENGRFSRLREPWYVQVHTIRMFCRLLKYHHGVNPVSGELMQADPVPVGGADDPFELDMQSESESIALHSCFSVQQDGNLSRKLSIPVLKRLRSADPLGDNTAGWDEVMGAPPENKNLIFEILKQIKPGMEMSKIPLPAYILEPRSVLERISDMFTHPDLFGKISEGSTNKERLLALLHWYVSSLHVKPRGLKKPYNPVLGETFECYFARGTPEEVHFFAEQVGHHPPVSVFTAVHTRTKTSITGSYMLKGRLISPNCACISIEGRFDLVIPAHQESWSLSFPSIYISSLLTTPRIEAGGEVRVTSPKSDLFAELSFERKGFFGGEYDVLKGSVATSKGPLMTIGGKWSGVTHVEDTQTRKKMILFDTESAPPPLRPFAPDTALPSPSRVIWEKVTVALREMKSDVAQLEKNELEACQREIRRAREARGEEYLPKFFRILNEKRSASEDQWLYIGPSLAE